MLSSLALSSSLLAACLTSFVVAQDLPDFSSYQYPGAPRVRSFQPQYDFCIVGGGTAGLVLANRLSESGRHQVVVFEAGGPPTDVGTYRTPGGNQYVLNGPWSVIDYNFQTVSQFNMNNRTFSYHRGRTLGGSSSTNGLYYGMGSSTVYDYWEQVEGNAGWNWDAIKRSAKKATTFVGNPNHTNDNTFMTHDPSAYGNGPLKIGFQGRVVPSGPSFMRALEALDIHPVRDQNSGSPIGIKQGTMTLDENFMRSSSYDSYYMQARNRSNLNVLDRAIVARIIFDEDTLGTDQVQAVGVTFVDSTSGTFHNVSCSKEVVLAAGAFHSPFILKQSGIGPAEELQEFGIEPVVVNENVGEHMQDHTAFSVIHAVKPEFAREASTTDMENDLNVLNNEQRDFYKGGESRWNSKWSAPSGCTNGFQEIPNDELESFGAEDIITANFTHQAHNEILYESVWYPKFFNKYGGPEKNTSYISITISNLAALSKGTVKIGSNSPTSNPVIDPNYLAEPADQAMAIQGVKYMRQVFQHPEMQRWSAGEVAPGPDVQSDEDILEYARTTMVPNWHASSTCRMLPKERGGVIDSRLRVYGTKGLRVCDVSTFGRLPDVNLVGPVYAHAELGASVIRADYGEGGY
ncbi:GMC oxidoreductase family protein Mala s [Fulvia fulva]|uniref:GMC oxidoreductase family protein Mala s n=1 Tax=Passalora fulva TaxID=5499 RepID=A0A9Q8LHD4_PASFU|nr:GMC oxidoreductase family protein Mala s [Fulvia fulva]KAK4626324.1 GMC oxidoreductase family protein Mala s [Fulvia fulva]KAK4628290.1 GMC oxidoreductase family protein Mala s [Fulvia fulva]UJO16658.1 GMC oxidoreductase family protein Mala s [Fulvia fulva]WPV14135.1 GMC oxidoreductase family protein Mala s [Fulvia fulva]WPV28993.1 GMC oxidoreductase family protein Mala s [Fulvia fulva]